MRAKSTEAITRLLSEPDHIDAVLCKVLAPNDDSGRHGVVVPVDAYSMFPEFDGFDKDSEDNYTTEVSTQWPGGLLPDIRSSRWKHYHRYPERRLTRLDACLNDTPPGALLLVARRSDQQRLYEVRLVLPSESIYRDLLDEAGLVPGAPGSFIDLEWQPGAPPAPSAFIRELVAAFDATVADGWHKTFAAGSPGVGETFEGLLGIARNNSPGPDWNDIELKCSKEGETSDRPKGLFLMEPKWVDGTRNLKERIARHGYLDDRGLPSWFQAAGVVTNSRGLSLMPDVGANRLGLLLHGNELAWWDLEKIEAKLTTKLTHTVFVAARSRGHGEDEEFRYVGLRYCSKPSAKRLLECIARGTAWVELRMGPNNGRFKNWGSQFRVVDDALEEVFSRIQVLKDRKA